MEEQHRLAMSADLGLAITQHTRTTGLELIAGGDDVLDLVADMMNAP